MLCPVRLFSGRLFVQGFHEVLYRMMAKFTAPAIARDSIDEKFPLELLRFRLHDLCLAHAARLFAKTQPLTTLCARIIELANFSHIVSGIFGTGRFITS